MARTKWGVRTLFGAALVLATAGCALFRPLPPESTIDQRLAVFPTDDLPLDGPVTVHWSEYQVPFIEAATDDDAAFTLGMVHAHLRLGQMTLFRRISQGRLSELAGPFTTDIDYALRILNFGRAAEEIEASLPAETRQWLERFVDGINHYQAGLDGEPYEFGLLGMARETWTVRDLIVMGRLSAVDVNWLVWFQLWPLRNHPDWPEIWQALVEAGSDSMPSFEAPDSEITKLTQLLGGLGRTGSNSFALSPSRTSTGHALIANDPHLGFMLPNAWLVAGFKSPSYHVAGLMVPGLPFVAVGRNPHIAWGGTNMRAASSDLFDVSALAQEEIETRSETIGVRWWFDEEVKLRDSRLGPVVSDAPMLESAEGEAVALRWVGHTSTDEFSAMLAVNRADDWQAFRDAFQTFGVSAQNMVYADTSGNIGQVMAVKLPARSDARTPMVNKPGAAEDAWSTLLGVNELPASLNPPSGFLASANNRPTETPVSIGQFFSSDDRIERLKVMLSAKDRVGPQDVIDVQTDVLQLYSLAIRDAVLDALERLGPSLSLDEDAQATIKLLSDWDGRYNVEAAAPVAYEAFLSRLLPLLYEARYPDGSWSRITGISHLGVTVPQEIARASDAHLTSALRAALAEVPAVQKEFPTWGDMHRLKLAHPLSNLPVIGSRFEFADLPVAGSRQTVMKSNASPSAERHTARYGSQARHYSDMSDIDANYFVVLGGQDGWFGSNTFLDQLALWRDGRYMQIPLRTETVHKTFPHRLALTPAKKQPTEP
jgi:penicillin amidase